MDIRNEILTLVWDTLLMCSSEFERVANGPGQGNIWTADRMPESWMVVSLMTAAAKVGIAAFPEVRANHDFAMCGHVNGSWKCIPYLKGKKIDLFLGKTEKGESMMQVLAAMELKGPKSEWSSLVEDLNRLRELARCSQQDKYLRLFGYVCPPKTDSEFDIEIKNFRHHTGLSEPNFEVRRSQVRSVRSDEAYSYVFIHVI